MKVILDEKIFLTLQDNGLVNTLKHFILLVLTLKALTFNSGSKDNRMLATINMHATWRQC